MRIRTRTIIIVFSETVRQSVTLALAIVLTRFALMDETTYGTYRLVEYYFLFLMNLMSLNLPASLYYFIPKLGDARRREVFFQTLILTLLTGLVGGGLLFCGADLIAAYCRNPSVAAPLRIYSLQAFAFAASALVPSFFISINDPVRAGVYAMLMSLLRAVPIIAAAALGYSLETTFLWLVGTLSVGALLGVADAWRHCGTGTARLGRALLNEQAQYVIPLQAATIVGVVNRQTDRAMISGRFSTEAFGAYANGATELPMVGIITSSVANAVMPNLVTLGAAGRFQEALNLWNAATRKCSLVIYPFFAFCLAAAPDLILLAFGERYTAATAPFIVFLFALPIRVAIYGAVLRALGETRPVGIAAALGLGLNLVVGLTLLWAGGGGWVSFIGPAVGVVVSDWLAAAYLLRAIARKLNTPLSQVMRWRDLGTTLALCLLAGLGAYALPLAEFDLAARISLRALAFGGLLALVFMMTGALKPDETEILRSIGRRLGLWRSRIG